MRVVCSVVGFCLGSKCEKTEEIKGKSTRNGVDGVVYCRFSSPQSHLDLPWPEIGAGFSPKKKKNPTPSGISFLAGWLPIQLGLIYEGTL